ncbi:rhodanese-related sulfurtransferase [Tritonibacter mobilis]|nr:rhodanese-related sulfurtransferase [Tritonibacter mobilis]
MEHEAKSFLKLKIKIRDKIVADGLEDSSFDVTNKGIHVDALKFNELIEDPDTVLVDMRNHYESEIGHFKGAITPDVDTFRDSLDIIEEDLKDHKEDKKLVMYCTGGIRCEKASAYYKHKGFKNVFQLEGGIIEYTRQVNEKGSKTNFKAKTLCLIIDAPKKLRDDVIANCHQCGAACDTHVNCANEACHLLFIQCEKCSKEMNTCCSTACKEINELPYEAQKALRKGKEIAIKSLKKEDQKCSNISSNSKFFRILWLIRYFIVSLSIEIIEVCKNFYIYKNHICCDEDHGQISI